MHPEEKIAQLGITLPAAATPAAVYVPFVQSGNLLFLSGHIPKRAGQVVTGQLGRNMQTADAKQVAREVTIDLLGTLKAAVGDAPAVVLAYGKFIQSVIDFIIVAFAIFMGVKAINRLKREEAVAPSAPPVPTKEEELLGEIRDLLKVQNNRP